MGNENHEQVKICPKTDCKHINDPFATYCANPECKSSLLYVNPVYMVYGSLNNAAGSSSRPSVVPATDRLEVIEEAILHCSDQPSFLFKVKSGDIIGRAGDVNISALERSNYISREHARFFLHEETWQLENLSKINPTLVNGQNISTGYTHSLSNGDEIILANTVFIFRFQEGDR